MIVTSHERIVAISALALTVVCPGFCYADSGDNYGLDGASMNQQGGTRQSEFWLRGFLVNRHTGQIWNCESQLASKKGGGLNVVQQHCNPDENLHLSNASVYIPAASYPSPPNQYSDWPGFFLLDGQTGQIRACYTSDAGGQVHCLPPFFTTVAGG